MAFLSCTREDTKFRIETQEFSLTLPDSAANRKACIVFLRSLRNKSGKRLYTLQELARIVSSENRQAASEHVEQFRASGEDIGDFLQRKRKLDATVIAAMREELRLDPLCSLEELTQRVNGRLSRTDITVANVAVGLEEIPCQVIRRALKHQLQEGRVSYDERYLLELALTALDNGGGERQCTQVERAGITPTESQSMKLPHATDDVVKALVNTETDVRAVNVKVQCIVVCLVLYFWGVPLRVLGQWLLVDKTTVLRWILGLTDSLWQVLKDMVLSSIAGTQVYLDEKWLKIRGMWYYWFVVVDVQTELPLYWCLLPRRTVWACRWVLLQVKRLGYPIRAVITDGFEGYATAVRKVFPQAVHQLCHFHVYRNIGQWLKEHFAQRRQRQERQKLFRGLFQTNDKRTVKRRLAQLEAASPQLGISGLVTTLQQRLGQILPAIGSRVLPRTTNGIERFFRAFMRFYKPRAGFHSVTSAGREFVLFVVVYLFTCSDKGRAPIEVILPQARQMPFYQLVNNPLQVFRRLSSASGIKKRLNGAIVEYSFAASNN